MGAVAGVRTLEDSRDRAGSADDFADVYRRYGRFLYGTALRMLRRPEDAEDAMQETFLIYHRKRAALDPSQLGGWLKRVLVNHCIDRLRQRRRRPETEIEEAPEVHDRPQDPNLDLEPAIRGLPERARMVFVLHDVEGYQHNEVAEMLGVTVGGSKSQLFRARRLLRGRLEPES